MFLAYREGLSSTKNLKILKEKSNFHKMRANTGLAVWPKSEQTFFWYNLNFIAVQISTQLISSPLRALFTSLRVLFGGSQ